MNARPSSIRTYLLLLVLAMTIPLLAIVGYGIYSDMQQTIHNAKQSLRTLIYTMVRNTGGNIEDARQILESLAARPLVAQLNPDNCDEVLHSLHNMNPRYANVAYANIDGRVVCSAVPLPDGKMVNIGRSSWFKSLLKEQKFSIGQPFLGPITGKQVSVMSVPIWNSQKEMIGGVLLPVNLGFYDPDIPIQFISKDSRYGFISDDNVLIWRNTDPEEMIGKRGRSSAAEQIVKIRDGEFEATGQDGIKRYYSVLPMPNTKWIAFVGVPSSEIYAAAERRAITYAVVTMLAIVLLLWLVLSITKRITKPIADLENVAKAIHNGNTSVRASETGPLEIASVAMAINTMIATQRHNLVGLNEAQKISHVGSYEWNPITDDLQWSDEHFRLWGLSPRSVVPSYALFRDAIHPDDIAFVEDKFQQFLRGENDFNCEFRVIWPDGSEHYINSHGHVTFDASGKPVRMLGTVQDLTERKQAEIVQKDNEQRFRYMLETCPTAARIAMKGGHKVIFFNSRYSALINATPDRVAGVDPAGYYTNQEDYAEILHKIENGEQIFERLVELKIPGAGTKWALASYLQIQYQGESAVLGWFHDITETIRVEHMKNEFVSTVSHELRTPLTAISGSLGLISGGVLGEIPERAKLMIDIAYRNSQRLTYLINDLLDMEKLVAGKMYFDMQQHQLMPLLLEAIESHHAYSTDRHIKLELDMVIPDITVNIDKQRLLQVLSNLLSNAIKYSPDDGVVQIAVYMHNELLRIMVIDHGPGIPDEFRNRIFQKFSQADSSDTRQKGGTGLGLAITRELVERMGGRIGFESEEGKGACFHVDLPVPPRKI